MDSSGFAYKNAPGREQETADAPKNLVSIVSDQQLLFDSLAVEVNKHLLQERQKIRNWNRKDLLSRFTDITCQISCCKTTYSMLPDIEQRRMQLERIKQDLEDIQKEIAADGIDCQVEQLARGLMPGEDIVLFAEENDMDQIYVGIRKKSRTSKLILGSTAQYIILKAKCPVISVK